MLGCSNAPLLVWRDSDQPKCRGAHSAPNSLDRGRGRGIPALTPPDRQPMNAPRTVPAFSQNVEDRGSKIALRAMTRSSILNPQSSILNPQSSILNHQSSILDPRSSILDPRSSILNYQASILNFLRQPSLSVRSRTDKTWAGAYDAPARLRVRKEVRGVKALRPVWDVNTLYRRVRRRLKRLSPSPLTISCLPHFPTNLVAALRIDAPRRP
jgi:hypothetical protein